MRTRCNLIFVMLIIFVFLGEGFAAENQVFPKNMKEFILEEKQVTKSKDFLDTVITVVKINPVLYKLQYEAKDVDVGDLHQLTYCMADFIAITGGFNLWDVGVPLNEPDATRNVRYVRYVVMRNAKGDDWIDSVGQEQIRLEHDFEQIERHVALARAYCPSQVQSKYLRQDKSLKKGAVYLVGGGEIFK